MRKKRGRRCKISKILKSKFIAILIAFVISSGLCAFVFGTSSQPTFAATQESGFVMETGASVRLDGNNGIRFSAKFPASYYNETAEWYMMIIPATWKVKYFTQDFNGDYYAKLEAVFGADKIEDNVRVFQCAPNEKDDGTYFIQAALVNILYENSNRKFMGIAWRDMSGYREYAYFVDGDNERSMCEVANAALNNLTKTYSDVQKQYLERMINNAYKVELGLKENETPEVALKDLLSVANGDNITINKGESVRLDDTITSTNPTITDKLGLTLGAYSNDDTLVVAEKGFLTAQEKTGLTTVGSVLLGQKVAERKVVVRSEMAETMLEDYADECSIKQYGSDKQSWINGGKASVWHDTFSDRQGVLELTSGQANGGTTGDVRFFYNRTYDEMINLDFDYISIMAYFTVENATIKNGNLTIAENVPKETWVELKIAKSDIDAGKLFRKSYKDFCDAHLWSASGSYLFKTATEKQTVYIDYVSFVKLAVSGDAPIAGTENYVLPTVDLLGIDGNPVNATVNNVVVTRDGESVTVTDGKINKIYSGCYEFNYIISYEGITYNHSLSYTVVRGAMADNMFEDFDDPTSTNSVKPVDDRYKPGNTTSSYPISHYATWHETFNGRNGVVETISTVEGQYRASKVNVLMNKTYVEMSALDWDYITISVYIEDESIQEGTYFYVTSGQLSLYKPNTEVKISANKWQEIVITKANMEDSTSLWTSNNYAGYFNGNTGATAFMKAHCNDMNLPSYLFGFGLLETSTNKDYDRQYKIYFDSITFGKNA